MLLPGRSRGALCGSGLAVALPVDVMLGGPVVVQCAQAFDRTDDVVIRCELELGPYGSRVVLTRYDGCTAADARELCRLVAVRDPAVLDRQA